MSMIRYIIFLQLLAVLLVPPVFSKGEDRFRIQEKGTIRGTEANPVVKGIEEVVHKININWAALTSKKRQIENFSGLAIDNEDLMRYRALQHGLKMDELAYESLLKDLNKRLTNTFSRVDDKDIYDRLKMMKKYETKENFLLMSKINEWKKDYEERVIKQKEIASDPSNKPEEDDDAPQK
jgi:hypothetical protein